MNANASTKARPPAVAGLFYPDDPRALQEAVDALLRDAATRARSIETTVKLLLVPHAGYVYSGAVAASAYALLARRAQAVRRVVLIGPAHRAYVRGLALPSVDVFVTPLGPVALDPEGARAAADFAWVSIDDHAHAHEHSLEVHLPFLQRTLGDFTVVPLLVGDATPGEVAAVLEALWGGPETLIVLSSDLSHFHPYARARALDAATVDAISRGAMVTPEQACGAHPLNGLAALRTKRALASSVLDLRNSGDTAGPREEVVGYLSMAFVEREKSS